MPEPHRNLAVYKPGGKPWTEKELENVMSYAYDKPMGNTDPYSTTLDRKYIFDDGGKSSFMYAWSEQESQRNFKHCKKIPYEELFKVGLKTYKVGNYET